MIEYAPWYVPTHWGDIRLRAVDGHCRLVAEKLSDDEKAALAALSTQAAKKRWIEEGLILGEGEHMINAPIDKVAKVIAKVLKPDRKLVSAVSFVDGGIEEHHGLRAGDEKKPRRGRPPKAAATVAAPRLGCPAPDFAAAHLRAQTVLESFLSFEQIQDFRRLNRFVTIGHSGRRYMVTSRLARDQLATYHRSLFDLEDKEPLCCHDYDVPAAEEMLAIHMLLRLPGWELYLRKLEGEDSPEPHAEAATHLERAMRAFNDPAVFDPDGGIGAIRDEYGRDLI